MGSKTFNINKYTYMDIITLLSGTLGGAILTEAGRITRYFIHKKSITKPSLNINKINEIYVDCMKPVLDETKIDRFSVYKVSNGGSLLVPGVKFYLSMLYEDYSRPLKSEYDKYQEIVLDKSLTKLFLDATVNGQNIVSPKDFEENTSAREILIMRKIKHSQIYFIAQTNKSMFYAACSSTVSEIQEMEPVEQAIIHLSVGKLREIFKDTVKYL